MRVKSFSARLAALEALEQQAETQTLVVEGPPDLAMLDDQETLWEATLAIRANWLQVHLSAPLGPLYVRPQNWCASAAWNQFYADLAPRATALLDALEKPVVFLADWEVAHVLWAIDAGMVRLAWSGYDNARRMQVMCDYRLWPVAQGEPLPDDEDERQARIDLRDTCDAVNKALYFVNRQLHYPQIRDFSKPEMATLAEWRAWLVSLGE